MTNIYFNIHHCTFIQFYKIIDIYNQLFQDN